MNQGTADPDGSPRLFLSYSWTSVDHQAWVLNLAERLVQDGVHVILDKWDLQPGHDAYVFMEQMVTDPTVTKVLMVSDIGYAEKADGRKGGVGTESQIITPALYGKAAQDKFAVAVTETTKEGQPTLPVFAKGRIYFDFSSTEREEAAYEQLLRWVHNKPQHVRPKLGKIPGHIADPSATVLSTESRAKHLENAIKNAAVNVAPAFRDYLEQLNEALSEHRIAVSQAEHSDEPVLASVEAMRPYVRQYQRVIQTALRYTLNNKQIDDLLAFLEKIANLMVRPENINSWSSHDFDNFKIVGREIFVSTVAIAIEEGDFNVVQALLDHDYYVRERGGNGHPEALDYASVFNSHPESLDARNQRLSLNRTSPLADLYEQEYKNRSISLENIMQADFILYLRSLYDSRRKDRWGYWWPSSLVYSGRRFHPFPLFVKSRTGKALERLTKLIGFSTPAQFLDDMKTIQNDRNRAVRFNYHVLPIVALSNAENLG